MSTIPKPQAEGKAQANRGRHESQCSICSHEQREEIEQAFVGWASPKKIASQHSVSKDAIYRHARALNLGEPRRRNVRAALERIIERGDDLEINAGAFVAAISAYARINASGQWVERSETVNMNELFNKMSVEELDRYAKNGELPSWFTATAGATSPSSQSIESGS